MKMDCSKTDFKLIEMQNTMTHQQRLDKIVHWMLTAFVRIVGRISNEDPNAKAIFYDNVEPELENNDMLDIRNKLRERLKGKVNVELELHHEPVIEKEVEDITVFIPINNDVTYCFKFKPMHRIQDIKQHFTAILSDIGDIRY